MPEMICKREDFSIYSGFFHCIIYAWRDSLMHIYTLLFREIAMFSNKLFLTYFFQLEGAQEEA